MSEVHKIDNFRRTEGKRREFMMKSEIWAWRRIMQRSQATSHESKRNFLTNNCEKLQNSVRLPGTLYFGIEQATQHDVNSAKTTTSHSHDRNCAEPLRKAMSSEEYSFRQGPKWLSTESVTPYVRRTPPTNINNTKLDPNKTAKSRFSEKNWSIRPLKLVIPDASSEFLPTSFASRKAHQWDQLTAIYRTRLENLGELYIVGLLTLVGADLPTPHFPRRTPPHLTRWMSDWRRVVFLFWRMMPSSSLMTPNPQSPPVTDWVIRPCRFFLDSQHNLLHAIGGGKLWQRPHLSDLGLKDSRSLLKSSPHQLVVWKLPIPHILCLPIRASVVVSLCVTTPLQT